MNKYLILGVIILACNPVEPADQAPAKAEKAQYIMYEPDEEYPFGRPNPDTPEYIKDWDELIGDCDCKSLMRLDQNTWTDTTYMQWSWKYIMNGWGVQDETFKDDSTYAGSIRQYMPDSAAWYVHYYSHPGTTSKLPAWKGNRAGDSIVLYNPQKAPNGMDGYYKITFSEITYDSFNWLGEWVDLTESFSYPTWKIYCKKRK